MSWLPGRQAKRLIHFPAHTRLAKARDLLRCVDTGPQGDPNPMMVLADIFPNCVAATAKNFRKLPPILTEIAGSSRRRKRQRRDSR